MRRFATALALWLCALPESFAEISLDKCLTAAEENYPLIERYGIIDNTTDVSLTDINKSWLPRINAYGQATMQNIVPEFPDALNEVLAKLGQEAKGIGRTQYKLGVDVTQTIWDGGSSKAQRDISRASSTEQKTAIAVKIYAVREKVIDLYFGILLIEEQIAQTENTVSLLKANHSLMTAMKAGGVAMQSDVDMVEAELLTMTQQLLSMQSAEKAYRGLLSIYTGANLDREKLVRPAATIPDTLESARPELEWFRARADYNNSRDAAVESSLKPRIGFFAQAWYGYPGINYFESMVSRDLSFNALAGVKISWNIDSFYTRQNSRRKLQLANDGVENDRDVFLFNTRLQTREQTEAIEGLRAVMAEDARIVALRSSVRMAAESQLRNGVIDATALLSKITEENQARLTATYHELQLLHDIYKLKHTLNR